jgi:diaminohydroxyphosphoribosylaminopyrimidine deaminase/5-amino-6-(5-phosphoribosylamino)uracil reductase
MGCVDPNPLVNGAGAAALRAAGIEVTEGVLKEECLAINRPFFHFVATGRPFVVLKAATTLDGKIAAARGDSRWVSGQAARDRVHVWRDELDAVLVGAGTVRTDDPLLTTRVASVVVEGREPRNALRIVVAGMAAIPMNSQILDAAPGPVLIAVSESKSAAYRHLTAKGAEILPVPGAEDRVDISSLLRLLGQRGVTSVMVEGGAGIYAAFLKAGLVDELRLFLAPRLVGGEGLSLLGPLGIDTMDGAWRVEVQRIEHVGEDVLIVCRPKPRSGGSRCSPA